MADLLKRIKAGLKKYSLLLQNFKYVAALQIFNVLIPLITYPYLIRVLGSETYGLIIFAQTIIGYFVMLIGFGFNISATKEISIHRDNKEKLNEICSSVLIIKGVLFLISVMIFFIGFWFMDFSVNDPLLFYITFYLCIYEWLFPFWYFQGIEKMKYITYLSILSRSVFIILIFILVKSDADYLVFPIVSALGSFLSVIIGLFIMFRIHKIKFIRPQLHSVKYYFVNSIPIFTSNLSLKLYTGTNKVIIGLFMGMQDVAFYDLGEKFLNLLKIPIASLSQVIFPSLAYSFNKGLLVKIARVNIVISIFVTFVIFMFTEYFIVLIGGEGMLGAANSVRILVLSINPIVLSNIFGVQALLTNNYNKEFFLVVFFSLCFYAIYTLSFYLFSTLNLINISFSILFTEIFMLIGFTFLVKKHKLI